MHWGDGDADSHSGVTFQVGGATGVWQSQVRKAQSMLRSPRRGQAASLPASSGAGLCPSFLVRDSVVRSTALLLVTDILGKLLFLSEFQFSYQKNGINQYLAR